MLKCKNNERTELSMKIRGDFVTNSSSSSFTLARKDGLTEKEKEIIVKFVEEKLFGEKILTPDNTEEEIQEVLEDYGVEKEEEKIKKALKAGKSIYNGCIDFEEVEYRLINTIETLWKELEETNKENFEIIDGDLWY